MSTVEKAPPIPSRKCSNCAEGVLAPMPLEKHAYRTSRRYTCGNCGAILQIDAVGFIGLYVCVWAIISTSLIYLFLWHDRYPNLFSYLVIGLFVGIGALSNLRSLIKHWTHPFVDPQASGAIAKPEADTRRKFDKLLDLGVIKTPLLVLLIATLILAAAGVVGMLNDYYFQ